MEAGDQREATVGVQVSNEINLDEGGGRGRREPIGLRYRL